MFADSCFCQNCTPEQVTLIFKVAILTFWFNLSSLNRVKRQRSEARGIPPNLTYHDQAPCRLPGLVFSHLCLASLSLRCHQAWCRLLHGGPKSAAEK